MQRRLFWLRIATAAAVTAALVAGAYYTRVTEPESECPVSVGIISPSTGVYEIWPCTDLTRVTGQCVCDPPRRSSVVPGERVEGS